MRILIAGCGYIGLEVGRRLVAAGHQVWGIKRTTSEPDPVKEAGLIPLVLDLTGAGPLEGIPGNLDVVINAVSTRGGEVSDYESVYQHGTRQLLAALATSQLQRYLMISSTSVYGQVDGSWVTEQSPAEPASETSRVLVATENDLLKLNRTTGFPVSIFRAAGIYGPGRGHLFHQFLRNEARMTGDGSRWLNMIHREDLVKALVRAVNHARPGEIYNVSDDEPVTEHDFFAWLAETLQRPMPPPREAGVQRRKRGATNKRISNSKLKDHLGYPLIYPTFREGYGAELATMTA